MNCVCVQMGGDGFLFCGWVTGELWVTDELWVTGELWVMGELCVFRWEFMSWVCARPS